MTAHTLNIIPPAGIRRVMAILFIMVSTASAEPFRFDTPESITQFGVADRGTCRAAVTTGGRVVVVWREMSALIATGGSLEGGGWSVPERISGADAPVSDEFDLSASGSGECGVVWRSADAESLSGVLSADTVSRWLTPEPIPVEGQSGLCFPGSAMGTDQWICVWMGREHAAGDAFVFSSRRLVSAADSWSEPCRIDDADPVMYRRDLTLFLSGTGTLWCIWSDDRGLGQLELWGAWSGDGGQTWSANQRIGPDLSGDALCPRGISSGTPELLCVFEHVTGLMQSEIRVLTSSNEGLTWELHPVPLNSVSGISARSPFIAADSGGLVAVAWTDDRRYHDAGIDGSDMWVAVSEDSGSSWYSENMRVNDNEMGENRFVFGNAVCMLPNLDLLAVFRRRLGDWHYFSARGRRPPTPTPTAPPGDPTYTPRPPEWTPTPVPSGPPWPTITPSPPPGTTPTPSPSPTPVCSELTVGLTLNQPHFNPGEIFHLRCDWCNPGSTIVTDHYIVLDIQGEYWFWPDWTQSLHYSTMAVPAGAVDSKDILIFTWPAGSGTAAGILVWTAFLDAGTATLLTSPVFVEFGYSS